MEGVHQWINTQLGSQIDNARHTEKDLDFEWPARAIKTRLPQTVENGELVRSEGSTGENGIHLMYLILVLGKSIDGEAVPVGVVLELGSNGGCNGEEESVELLGEVLDFLLE